jgi:multidrug transporter EmrE-like cation transporter
MTAIGGVVLLGEPLNLARMGGLAVILVGVAIVALN